MKTPILLSVALLVSSVAFAGTLPIITNQPQNQTVPPGNDVALSVTATGATDFQWRFNGTDLSGATTSALQITNAQSTNTGYYMAVVKNETGWVPSQMAYLSVVAGSGGRVPFSNQWNLSAQACYQVGDFSQQGQPITNGSARILAGPALDQMRPASPWSPITNGYFSFPDRYVPTVSPGQTVYYRVDISYPYWGGSFTQRSTVLKLVAGGNGYPTPSAANLKFPLWPEWPEPGLWYWSPTNQVRVPGESFTLTNQLSGYGDFGIPTIQWRKDGKAITEPTNFGGSYPLYGITSVLTITNLQAADVGIYDTVVIGNNWFVGPKICVSVQLTNGPGVFRFSRIAGSSFLSDLEGAPGRQYAIEWSTNLVNWNSLCTLSNITGTVTVSNALAPDGCQFYRAALLP